jgi:hypothetical protein
MAPTIKELEDNIKQLRQLIQDVISSQNLEFWISPVEAEKRLPIGRDRIYAEIAKAEEVRIAYPDSYKKKTDLWYGEHYFNASKDGEKNFWKIHLVKFWAIVSKPPEERV